MIVFAYTFVIIFIALVVILGLGSLLAGNDDCDVIPEGEATAAMCTTKLLDRGGYSSQVCDEDFVIEQDLVYTYDSINL